MPATPAEREALPRSLGLFGAITIVVGITIGSGIFRSPAGIADRLPGPGPMLLVWVVGGVLAFRFGWAELVITRAAAIGAISITFAEYFLRVLGYNPLVVPLLSTFGSLNSTMLANPRVFFAMAENGLFFKSMAAVHPRFKTPVNAIALAALLGVAFVLLRRFEDLADAFVTAILPFCVLGVGAIFVVRARPGYVPAFRSPGYPIVPILFILATLYLLVNAVVDPGTRWPTIGVFVAILVGIPVYFATVGRRLLPPDGARRTASETA